MVKGRRLQSLVADANPSEMVKVEKGNIESEIKKKLDELENLKAKFMKDLEEVRKENAVNEVN